MALINPVILCGGSGTRLWPLSRQSMPKQFLNLIGENSLFQQAAQRFSGSQFLKPLVLTSNEYRFIAAHQLSDIDVEHNGLILEPSAKNTAPAILAAAQMLYSKDPDALMLVMPSDHYIPERQLLIDLVLAARATAEDGMIVTFGIKPARPETGFGYIELGVALSQNEGYRVSSFHEKPDEENAREMLNQGTYLWNSGLFLARCETVLSLAEQFVPDMLSLVKDSVINSVKDLDFLRLDKTFWRKIEALSFDYAIMEKADNTIVFPFLGVWSDLGDWSTLKRELYHSGANVDSVNNILVGNCGQINCESCLIWSEDDEQVIAAVGLKDTIVVSNKNAVLVIDAKETNEMRAVVELASQKNESVIKYPREFRPWGFYSVVAQTDAHQIRHVSIYPKKNISLQKHDFRDESWFVTRGIGKVQIEQDQFFISKGECIAISAGQTHQISNESDNILELIEVITGTQLVEDDVERFSTI